MPELPEVENVVRTLRKNILNKNVIDVKIYEPGRLINSTSKEFKESILSTKITSIDRIAKYIILNFERISVVVHLRMEGRWYTFDNPPKTEFKHKIISLHFEDNSLAYFLDTRKFATIELVEKENVRNLKSISKLGIEANSDFIDPLLIFEKFQKISRTIKATLLDQQILSGIGNIYADEILFDSKIHPLRISKSLSLDEVKKIIKSSKKILDKSIELGGSTVNTFEISHGSTGNYSQFLKVYGRQNKKCFACDAAIIKIKVSGRGTHFCPHCQVLNV